MSTDSISKKTLLRTPRWITLIAVMGLGACSAGGGDNNQNQGPDPISLSMQIPASLTGGKITTSTTAVTGTSVSSVSTTATASSGTGQPCAYQGPDDKDDPFRNGYEMTKFMVSAVAAWTCWADTLIDISAYVPHDGLIRATDNQTDSANYEPDDPTHYSVVDDSETQTTIRIYYGYPRDVPPLKGSDPQFYISFNKAQNGDIEGRLIINALQIDPDHRDPKDPSMARMDFNYTGTQQLVTMYLQFDNGNPWADGFRIEVTKDLTADFNKKVFVSRGLIAMKRQFFDLPDISQLPTLDMYTVSDRVGNGAAIASYNQFALPLPLNFITGNHLGNYIFDKTDTYFFDADQKAAKPWDWIYKTFTSAQYRGHRTTPATGGTLVPFDPSLDVIVSELGLPGTYFTGTECANIGDSCVDLLNAIFADGFGGQEANQGADPGDWRSEALLLAQPLTSVYPNGVDWSDAFAFNFSPTP